MSGYGVHSRQVVRWALSRKDFQVRTQLLPWGVTPWHTNPANLGGLVGEIMKLSLQEPKEGAPYDVSLQIQLPNEWDPELARVNVGITAAVETDRCNPEWVDACNRMTAVVVPSEHTKKVLKSPGNLNVPIIVIPEAFHDACSFDDNDLPKLDLNLKSDFNFLLFGQLTGNNPNNDRKNLFYTLKWICEEFSNDSDVGVVVKSNSGRMTKIDRIITEKIFSQVVAEVRRGEYPKVYLLHGHMDDDQVAALYRHQKIKAMVTLTRGEGFGLPILEAAASGLPIIATAWSGHMDFMRQGKFIGVNYSLDKIHPSRVDNHIFVENSKWANPVEADAKKKLRTFYRKPEIPKQWALKLRDTLRESHSYEGIRQVYEKNLAKLIEEE